MFVLRALGRQRQEVQRFKVILCCIAIASPMPARDPWDPAHVYTVDVWRAGAAKEK